MHKNSLIKFLFTLHLSLLFLNTTSSQELNFAKEIVSTLASSDFHGRGYVSEGDKLAADYIGTQFEKIGLESFKKNYFQKFSLSVNTFPTTMSLAVNGEKKIAGQDYLIEPGSPGIKGEFNTITLTADDINDSNILGQKLRSSTGRFIIVPTYDKNDYTTDQQKLISDVIAFLKFHPNNPASGSIILTNEKLTWSGSTVLNSKPSFTLSASGIQKPIEKVTVDVVNEFFNKYQSQNVVGFIEGNNTDSLIVFVAHYDHLGKMGSEAIFPGANDNASGIAMLLNLANYYKSNKPKYTTAFIAFGGEELGLLGAKHFVENPLFKLSKIKFLMNFDISGTGDDGIQVVNGKIYKDKFDRLVAINSEQELLKQVNIRGEACNSDHCMFHMNKVPCFFIYTLGGIQAYHDIYDKAETLPLTEFQDYFNLITQFIDGL